MIGKRTTWAVVAAAAVLVGGYVTATASGLLKGTPTAAAVVNVQAVFDALKEKTTIEAELQQRGEKLQAEQQDRQKQIQQMRSELDLLTPGTENFRKKQEELERTAIELQAWVQYENQKLQRERGIQIEGIYNKTLKAVADVAKANGYQLVLFSEGPPDLRWENAQQLSALVQLRKVLYYDPALDITELVTQKMNNDYQNR